MNAVHEKLLSVLRFALRGEKLIDTLELSKEEWMELFRLAHIHKVLPMIFDTVYASMPPEIASMPFVAQTRRQTMQQVMAQTIKTNNFMELNRKLQDAGIKALVVKGIICRNLYPKPDNRQSADEDILIPAEQFEQCHQVMLDFDMQTMKNESEMAEEYELPYMKEGASLYIELHKHLFPPESEAYGDLNRFFEDVFDRSITEHIDGVPVRTMEYTDHLFYLICHAFKHFIHSGFGIRQVCDIVMYANAYGSRIDWLKILQNCREIHGEIFAAALFKIGQTYLVFDAEKAGYPQEWKQIKVDETNMLRDLLESGVYGGSNLSRKHSSNLTLDVVAAQKQGKKKGAGMLSTVFPSVSKLESRYPYLKKHPYLLPLAWMDRLLKYHKETKHSENNKAVDALRIGNERIELLKQYGIVK